MLNWNGIDHSMKMRETPREQDKKPVDNNYLLGKTWLTALFCIVRCILFPQTKICIASATRPQANEVLSKITDDFMKNYGWGSENLKREISYFTVGTNKAVIEFANGSWIKVVTASDSGRGKMIFFIMRINLIFKIKV